MDLLDKLLATSARTCSDGGSPTPVPGAPPAEKDRLEYDARSLITTWGGRASSDEGLHDYANREWAGLVGGLYRTALEDVLRRVVAALAAGQEPARIDWFALEDRWARPHDSYPDRATVPKLARQVRDTLAADPHQVALTASADRGAVAEGRPATVDGVVHQPQRIRPGDGRGPVGRRTGGHDRRAGRHDHRGVGRPGRDVLGGLPSRSPRRPVRWSPGCRRARPAGPAARGARPRRRSV